MAKQKILRADIFWSRRDKKQASTKKTSIDQLRDKPKPGRVSNKRKRR